jgi:hypothetical protein
MRLADPSLAVEPSSIISRKPFTVSRDGFSLNCAVACAAHERAKLERVCRPRKWTAGARGTVTEWMLELVDHQPIAVDIQPLEGDGPSGDVTTNTLRTTI